MSDETIDDDEFALLADNAADAGLEWRGRPDVRRVRADVDGCGFGAIAWGTQPIAVFLHGGAQNAHTWDTTALALGLSIVAFDLPGHGRSDWRPAADYGVPIMAAAVAAATAQLAPSARAIVGIGLGASVGLLTADLLGARIERLVLVDSASGGRTPAPDAERAPSQAAAHVAAFTATHSFPDLEAIVARTAQYSPHRSRREIERGVRHNARRHADGTWSWRWDPRQRESRDYGAAETAAALRRFAGDVLLVRGERSDIVTDDAIAEFTRAHPRTTAVTIAGAGHAVQGDQPVALAGVLRRFLEG